MSRGFTILTNYTYSKSIDDLPVQAGVTGFDTSSALPWDADGRHQFDRGPSEFDHTHRFVASFVWELPALSSSGWMHAIFGNWQVSGLVQAQTGRPVTVLQGSNISGTGIGKDRGTFTGSDPYAGGACAASGTTAPCSDWISPAAFKLASDPTIKNTFGTVGKGSLRFPGLYTWDMGFSKTFGITERLKLQFRAEFFDIFNRVNYLSDEGTVNSFSSLTTRTFGGLTAGGDPRIGQMALKLNF